MNNMNEKRKQQKRKRLRNLPSKSKTFKPVGRAAIAAGALTLSLIFTSCGEGEESGAVGGTGSGSTTDIVTTAPVEDGTYETSVFEEIPFEKAAEIGTKKVKKYLT